MTSKRQPRSRPVRSGSRRTSHLRPPTGPPIAHLGPVEVAELDSVRAELERLARDTAPARWNAEPGEVRRSVAKLVLTLVEFIRQLLERQAIRRMDAGTLSADETEAVGLALMRLEETVHEIGAAFGLAPEDLNLDLGPVGRLM